MQIRTDKILFVGDTHLDSTTPSSRVDDYADTSISKLYSLRNLCILKDIKCVVILGDVFNKHDQSNTYLNRVLKVFKSFKDSNISIFTIVGNHDISFERLDTLERSPLQVLFTAGLINHLDYLDIHTGSYLVRVVGLDYPDSPIPVNDLQGTYPVNILCAHRFYNYAFNDPHNLTSEDCSSLGYNIYAMGHDHIQYDVEKMPRYWVIRPGSFMRTSAHTYNLTRSIAVDLLTFQGTAEAPMVVYSRESLPTKPGSEVFSTAVFNRAEDRSLDLLMDNLHSRVSEMLNQMDVRHENKDIYKTLDSICTDPAVKQVVETYLSLNGYSRR